MIQSEIFETFADLIKNSSVISAMVDGQIVSAPQIPPLNYFVGNADKAVHKTAVLLKILKENTQIKDQGFKSQYRVKVDFLYEVLVMSKQGQTKDYCEEVLNKIRVLCENSTGELVFNNSDGAPVFNIEESREARFWQGTLNVSGFCHIKEI